MTGDKKVPPRIIWLVRAMVAALAFVAFGPSVGNPLVPSWDDGRFLVDFPPVQSITWEHFVTLLTEVHFEAWHPLHLLSYWLDVPWAGTSGPAIDATSLVLWVFALWLLLAVYTRLGLPLFAALLGTLVVGLHPVQVEAVTWATGRKEVLALGFSCASILAHLAATDRGTDRAALGARVLSGVFYILAAMSKTTVLPLPGLLFLIDVLLREVPFRVALKRLLPLAMVGGVLSLVVVGIWRDHDMIRDQGGAGTSAALVAASYTHHLTTALFPGSLSPVYPIHRAGALPLSSWIGPLVLAGALVLALRKKSRRAAFTLSAFVLLLLPAANVIPVYFQFQDRYLSLPLFAFGYGAAALCARFAERMPAWKSAGMAIGFVIVLALAGRTIVYGGVWARDLRLWGHAASTQPDAFYAWLKLGEVRRDAGHLAGAIDAYDRAIAVAPTLRLGYGGRFSAVALKDERDYGAHGPSAMGLSSRYMQLADDPDGLRLFASNLAEAGYRGAVKMALGRSLDLAPIPDERLEHAAMVQHERGHAWLASFYVERMSRPPINGALGGYSEP